VGETAVIKGENLGSSRENVIIEFIHATSDKVYPSDQNDLEVEEVSPTKIEVKVPEIDDTLPEDVSVRVTVDGLTAEQDAFVLELE
jgi:hypothetical protein